MQVQPQSSAGNNADQANQQSSAADVAETLITALKNAAHTTSPYPNWFAENCLPADTLKECIALPFAAPDLGEISGKRELHNKTRQYFDADNQQKFTCCHNVAAAFQDKSVTTTIEQLFNIDLATSYLRIEYAQDTDGFWLEPHTDLGVKLFTMLLYLSTPEQHKELGTDIYDQEKQHLGRSAFEPNAAFIFVPSDITYHGFERRPIEGVRKSIIINYVTDEWRAREQLAYPDQPIA